MRAVTGREHTGAGSVPLLLASEVANRAIPESPYGDAAATPCPSTLTAITEVPHFCSSTHRDNCTAADERPVEEDVPGPAVGRKRPSARALVTRLLAIISLQISSNGAA